MRNDLSPPPPAGARARPAAFLDRDGVINVDTGYPHLPEHLRLTPSAAEAVRCLNDTGYLVIVISNQSGVARGYFGEEDVQRFHGHLRDELARASAHIDAFYYCPYHPDGSVPRYAIAHDDRKPAAGMILRAMREWRVRPEGSFVVGDKPSDLAAADNAGLPGHLVESDHCDLAAVVRAILAP